jgi:hypothetical protein
LLAILAVSQVGCAGPRNRSVDFSNYRVAQQLTFTDRGSNMNQTPKNSVTVTDPVVIDSVFRFLQLRANDWQIVPYTPPSPRFTLSSGLDGKVTDIAWLDPPPNEGRNAYIQKRGADGDMYCTDLAGEEFHELLAMLGVSNWQDTFPNH